MGTEGFNPYSTGLSILSFLTDDDEFKNNKVSILILLDYQFYLVNTVGEIYVQKRFNPYSTGLSILSLGKLQKQCWLLKVSILILLDYQFYPLKEFIESKTTLKVSILILLDYQFYLRRT